MSLGHGQEEEEEGSALLNLNLNSFPTVYQAPFPVIKLTFLQINFSQKVVLIVINIDYEINVVY